MAIQRIGFQEWMPDQPSITENLQDANNVTPLMIGYAPFNLATEFSGAASEDLNNSFVGKFSDSTQVFAGGPTKLFKLGASDTTLTNVSKSGGYTGLTRWSFCQFGDSVIAANNSARLQYWTLGSSSLFADLAADAPIAKYVAVVRDFVVTANLGNGTDPNKVQWSDLNNETVWTSGAASQADFQIIPDGGDIVGITGGEIGIIFLERAIVRMSYIGSPFFFQFDNISRNLGCITNGSIAQYGGLSFFLSDEGFYSCDGKGVANIGANKIDKWFFNNADINAIDNMSSAVDPVNKVVIWNYANIFGGRSLLIYNWQVKKWTRGSTDVDYMSLAATARSSDVTIDNLYRSAISNVVRTSNVVTVTTSTPHNLIAGNKVTVEAVTNTGINGNFTIASTPTTTTFTYAQTGTNISTGADTGFVWGSIDNIDSSLDNRVWTRGLFVLAGVRGPNIVTFTGDNASANLTTGDIESGYDSVVTLARLQIDNGSGEVAVASRTNLDGNIQFGNLVPATSENRVPLRSFGRYHRFNVVPTGNWNSMLSIDVDIVPSGTR